MSHSLSPTNRSSIFGWVKNLKKGNLTSNESVDDVLSDNENSNPSPTKSTNLYPLTLPHSHSNPHQEFLRPLLHHKSRSTNNVSRQRSNSFNQSDKSSSIRQHRDSFFQSNAVVDENSKYFGLPLEDAIHQASAKISILNNDKGNHVLQYGEIPIVVAKCGLYLKAHGLKVEGIFRVGGSSKRLKELQIIFNSPPDFGKKLNWDGYTVHDAASILRRYLNSLPEPLIPLDMYEEFRDALRKRPRIINYMKYKAENPNKSIPTSIKGPSNASSDQEVTALSHPDSLNELLDTLEAQPLTEANMGRWNTSASSNSPRSDPQQAKNGDSQQEESLICADSTKADKNKKSVRKAKNYKKLTRDVYDAINEYKEMVDNDLPILSKQLLFYILDLLAMVQNNSAENLMSSRNLAAIFQPSILSHPDHDMDPIEYALSQSVVEFLIRYAYKLLPNQNPQNMPPELLESKMQPQTSEETTNQSTTTSTSTTPLEVGSSEILNKPKLPPFKRHHSKSLSSSNNHDDLIGYQRNSGTKKILMLDSDNDFEITDDDNEVDNLDLDSANIDKLTLGDQDTPNGKNSDGSESKPSDISIPAVEVNPNVAIVVSKPTSDAKEM
ncbi:uncharacterized protein PRCAT00000811001 [Priceomyces carsonii]|uniref:uncharacterized protein n=1 Tax=Priceomyces carsonii TaxID=28549 RepID=UPI002EDB804D|nr:unnamed protein product [Priceomyces carsonii]